MLGLEAAECEPLVGVGAARASKMLNYSHYAYRFTHEAARRELPVVLNPGAESPGWHMMDPNLSDSGSLRYFWIV